MDAVTTQTEKKVEATVPAGPKPGPRTGELAAGLHPQVFVLFAGTYAAILVALWLFFGTDVNAMIALVVSTTYFAMYFGVPFVMLRMAGRATPPARPDSFATFLRGKVDTNTGPVSGWGAVAQLLTIPVGLAGAFIAIGIISRLSS